MSSTLKWLILLQLLINQEALCRVLLPPMSKISQLPENKSIEKVTAEQEHPQLQELRFQPENRRGKKAQIMTSILREKLEGKFEHPFHLDGNVSCEELMSASTVDDPLSSMFPQELLGLSMVPVLVVTGCIQEAQTLVLKLYNVVGVADTDELLMEVGSLIESRMGKSTKGPLSSASQSEWDQIGRHMEAVMYNIQQLALDGEGVPEQTDQCKGWTRVNGTMLVGTAVDEAAGGLDDAVSSCERLGVLCAGVTSTGSLMPGLYQAVLKKGSRILPSESTESECWIHQCSENVVVSEASTGRRTKRSPQRTCVNKSEQRVYNVVEWIPAVSTLYNLGTAVYYASVNCSQTAKERAILSAVDLGTDAIMVATGGTAGVAGYALGAGVKTGVKAGVRYLLNTMKHEDDVLVNQVSREEGIFTIQ
ncbi:uncharacterized protein apof [Gouania willdenowi]|uniref:Apolipoprotein F n=1 Tax=Gouania willdenowi TaxID=441366 RepID=A0A8C5G9D4_GOUWI|nr:apolipoprotein F [Gouania willdenowi]